MKPSHSELTQLLHYDPETGVFTWLSSNRGHDVGDIVGSLTGKGYLNIAIRRKQYLAQVLAWFYMTKEWPDFIIDHENRITSDNRWVNLRKSTVQQNSANRGVSSQNKLKVKGVRQEKNGKFLARITVKSKSIHLGTFPTLDAASDAYDDAAIKYFGEFALTNKILRGSHGNHN